MFLISLLLFYKNNSLYYLKVLYIVHYLLFIQKYIIVCYVFSPFIWILHVSKSFELELKMISQTLWWENVSQVIHLLYRSYIDLLYRWTINPVYEVHRKTVSNFLMFNLHEELRIYVFNYLCNPTNMNYNTPNFS